MKNRKGEADYNGEKEEKARKCGKEDKTKKIENSYGLENHRISAIKPTLCEWVGGV